MNSNRLKPYKGYIGTINIDVDAGILYGEILDIPTNICYDATTLDDLQQEFEFSVEEYLKMSGISDVKDYFKGKYE